jgi:hypothetical protein
LKNQSTGKPPQYINRTATVTKKMLSETAETLKSYDRKEQKLSEKRARPAKPVRAGRK